MEKVGKKFRNNFYQNLTMKYKINTYNSKILIFSGLINQRLDIIYIFDYRSI